MHISLTPQLREEMRARGRYGIIVEIARSDSSDFEVTELHTHFVNEKQAELFVKRQGFHPMECDGIQILLPNYRLSYSDEVVFSLRRLGPFSMVKAEGIGF